ncbi:MAG: hypothetical protein JNK82_26615, partial [Myxococcaceae bacterium]|nr:hypothetical protein [Myxococcaceae bacterium]
MRPLTAAPVLLALLAAACPRPVSLECRTCDGDADCAPQGLGCRGGWCEGATACLPPARTVADAGVLFADDFEGRVLAGPDGGPWRIEGPTLDHVIGLTDAGRYGVGLSLADNGTTNGQFGRYVERDLVVTDTDVYVRSWLWLDANGGPTGPHAVVVYSTNVAGFTLAEALLRDGAVSAKCADATMESRGCNAPRRPWPENEWHAVELSMEGLGTAAGRCALYVDGELVCATARDYRGVKTAALAIGATAMNEQWTGELRADAVSVTTRVRPAGQLVLVPPTARLVGGLCAPVRIELEASGDGGVPGLAARTLELELGGGGQFFAAGCTGAALSRITVAPGASFVELAYRPPLASQVTVTVTDLALDRVGFEQLRVLHPAFIADSHI